MKRKFLKFLHPRSIFLRLFLAFLVLMLPLEIAGLSFLSWSKDRMKEEIEATARISTHNLTRNFEVELNNLSSHLTRISNNNLFTQFVVNHQTFSNVQYYTSLLDQSNLLSDYPNIYPLVEDIIVYYPSDGSTISAQQGFHTGQDSVIEQKFGYIQEYDTLIKKTPSSLFLSMLYPVSSIYTQNTPMYFISMELSNDAIVDYLDTSSQNYDTAMYLHSLGNTLYSSSVDNKSLFDSYLHELDALLQAHPQETSFSWSDAQYYILAEYSPLLQCSFIQFIPMTEVFLVPNRISLFLTVYILLSLPIVLIFYRIISKLIVRPMNNLLDGYRRVEDGDYTTSVPENTSTMEFQLLIRNFNKMIAHLRQAIDQVFNYRLFTQKMELKQLQMQMNPHFLYNTYFILHRLIKQENMEEAVQLSSYLGSYFQYITRSASDMVPLKKEWEHAENYLKIQEIRFSPRVKFLYDILPEKFSDFQVPRLILQPLLENALEHGMKQMQNEGILTVRFVEYPDCFEILVNDNGNTLMPDDVQRMEADIHAVDSPNKEFTALHNIHRRLQLVYGSDSYLKLSLNAEGGLCVHIVIPLTLADKGGSP